MHLSPLNSTTVIHFFTTYLNSLLTACSLFKTPLPELLFPLLNASITYLLLSKLYTGCPFANALNSKLLHLPLKPCSTKQPSYLHDLLIPYQPPRPLRSSDLHLLDVPDVFSARGRRSFLFAAPTIWNSLPISLRCSSSVASFLSGLKTHLFSLRFPP